MNEILSAINISKNYKEGKEVEVLKDLNLEIQTAEMIVIMGPSGSGKTTLINILGGIDKPSSGKVLLDGIDIFAHTDTELSQIRNQKIGFVFQFHQLLPEFTAIENLKLVSMLGNNMQKESFYLELLKNVGLEGKEARIPAKLSGGERQRVGIARALVNTPSIVLADEPTGNLDAETSEELHKLFAKLNREHRVTFIIATHKEAIAKLATRIFTLESGKLRQI
ncbi:MAG: ABC transporter ATP-binding protein [bacterium]|nr:ABC transporter ATP-binding protein [bacterium]